MDKYRDLTEEQVKVIQQDEEKRIRYTEQWEKVKKLTDEVYGLYSKGSFHRGDYKYKKLKEAMQGFEKIEEINDGTN